MNFNDYQEKAKTTAMYIEGIKKQFPNLSEEIYHIIGISYVGLGLGECGEVQNKIKKIIRDDNCIITEEKRKDIKKELGDILWYVANTASEFNIFLNDIAEENIEKLFSRKERGVIQGSGDNR